MTPTFIRRGDVELAVRVEGPTNAPVVLLVHGYPDTSEVWSEIVPRLGLAHRVITYDVRGAGASSRPTDAAAYDLSELADDAAAVIDACAGGRAVHVVGHDWGAIQTWELVTTSRASSRNGVDSSATSRASSRNGVDSSASVTRGRVASFTSISGPCLDHVGHWIQGAARSPARMAEVIGQAPRSVYIGLLRVPGLAEHLWPVVAPYWPAMRDRAEGRGARAGHPAETLAEDGAVGARLYRRNILRRVRAPRDDAYTRVPVQIIVPLRDKFVSRSLAVDAPLGHAPGATRPWVDDLVVREVDAGHWCVRSAPDAVARAIAEYVARVEAGRGAAGRVTRSSPTDVGAGDAIRPRRVSFDLSRTPVPWIPGDRFTSHVTDVLHLLLPAGERWFVDVYRETLPLVTDERLRAEVRGFMGQEATHARVHDLVLAHMRSNGVDTDAYTRKVEWMFEHVFGARPPRGVPLSERRWLELRLGGIAAVEHFTCVLGKWICSRSAALDAAGADPAMLALLRWHGAEEIEHRSVAFDTLVHIAGRRAYAMRAAGMMLAVPIMTYLWDRGTRYLVDRDEAMSGTRAGYRDFVRAARQRRLPGGALVAAIPRFLSPRYHPRHEALTDVARAHLQNAR